MKKRVSRSAGLVLVDGDLSILRYVYEFRFLRRDHLGVLTSRNPKRLHRRLIKLARNGFLQVTRLPQQKHIYSIGSAGFPVLKAHGIVPEDAPAPRLRVRELKELFLRHEMLIVDHHVMLNVATREGRFRLVDWREGIELFDSVMVATIDGQQRLPVRPDAFFTIEDRRRTTDRNRFHFFLEIDRSTMPHISFAQKIAAYRHYREEGRHAKRFRIDSFRVLTVALTVARAQNLCDLASRLLPEGARKHFLFTDLGNYSLADPERIFATPFLSARGERQLLIPSPNGN